MKLTMHMMLTMLTMRLLQLAGEDYADPGLAYGEEDDDSDVSGGTTQRATQRLTQW